MSAGFRWPNNRWGEPLPTVYCQIKKRKLCEECWNGKHPGFYCIVAGCQCQCHQVIGKDNRTINMFSGEDVTYKGDF